MSHVALFQQQGGRAILVLKPRWWDAATLQRVTQSPHAALSDIEQAWGLIADAMSVRGLWDRENAAAVAATVAIETARTWRPVREAYWMSEGWRKNNLRYWPWYGRGYIQLTWEDAYRRAQDELDIPVHDDPDAAMIPENAAKILANFWNYKGIAPFAWVHNWREVRRRVQGADAGLNELTAYADELLRL